MHALNERSADGPRLAVPDAITGLVIHHGHQPTARGPWKDPTTTPQQAPAVK